MIDTLSCQSENELTEKFFEKLLIGAIDKRVDYDEIEGSWDSAAEANGQGQRPHPPSLEHLQRSMVNDDTASWPTDEKRDTYCYEHQYSQPAPSQIQTMHQSRTSAAPSLAQRPRFSPRADSQGEIGEPDLPRSESHPQVSAELSSDQPARSKTFGSGKSIFQGLWPRS